MVRSVPGPFSTTLPYCVRLLINEIVTSGIADMIVHSDSYNNVHQILHKCTVMNKACYHYIHEIHHFVTFVGYQPPNCGVKKPPYQFEERCSQSYFSQSC